MNFTLKRSTNSTSTKSHTHRPLSRVLSLALSFSMAVSLFPAAFSVGSEASPSSSLASLFVHALFSNSREEALQIIGKDPDATPNPSLAPGLTVGGSIYTNGILSLENGLFTSAQPAIHAASIDAHGATPTPTKTDVLGEKLDDFYDALAAAQTDANIEDYGYSRNQPTLTVSQPIVGKKQVELTADSPMDGKMGAFSAAFVAKMYADQATWKSVLPGFEYDPDPTETDLRKLNEASTFIGVQEGNPSGWENYEKLPGSLFMDLYNSRYVAGLVEDRAADAAAKTACTSGTIVTISGSWGTDTVNPAAAQNAEKIIVQGGNFTLNGNYPNLREIKFENNGGSQLIGSFPALQKVYASGYGNLNLAGNFSALTSLYMPSGQLLLGTSNAGFSTKNATIVNENGTVTVYTAQSCNIIDTKILTAGKLAVRGAGKTAPASQFNASGSLFAANTGLTVGDMHDDGTAVVDQVPVFFSQSGLSIVNSSFELLQGAFSSRNGTMTYASTNANIFRGFLFAQHGIDDQNFAAKESVYVEGDAFNIAPGLGNEGYLPSGSALGSIKVLEPCTLPDAYKTVEGAAQFIEDLQKEDGVETYRIGSTKPNTSKIFLNENVLAEDNRPPRKLSQFAI